MPKQARIKPSKKIRNHKSRCRVFDATFTTWDIDPKLGVTQEQAKAIAAALGVDFDRWWDSWIEPELEHLAKRGY